MDGNHQGQQDISSPFSAARALPARRSSDKRLSKVVIAVLGLLTVAMVTGGIFGWNVLSDPYRKLEEFPVTKYFESFQVLAGLKFRSHLRVEADLGWKEGIGRLMVLTPNGESRQLAVFVPPSLSGMFFNKGQNYVMELEVKDGGLIYANSCRKD